MRIGWLEVPAALIREPRRKISAETFVGPPFCDGGFLPTTSVPGSMVIVTPGCTNVRPSTSTRQPAVQCWLAVMLPVTVARLVQLSPPDPEPLFEMQIDGPTPPQSG